MGILIVLSCVSQPQNALAQATCELSQITDTTAGHSLWPSISGDGTRIAFSSSSDLVSGQNTDGNNEIFSYDIATGFLQLTDTSIGFSYFATVNGDGSRVAFQSTRDIVTGQNPDGNTEIFLYDNSTGFTQITNTIGGNNFRPQISADGTRLVFRSNNDLVLGQNTDGNVEIFLYDTTTGFTQITNTSGLVNTDPSISADGMHVALASTNDLVSGQNLDANYEIFLYDVASAGLTQITNTTTGSSREPSINADGTRISFSSGTTTLLPGQNPDGGSEIFLYDTTSGFVQVTDTTPGITGTSSISGDGTRIAFISNRDIISGQNTDGNIEIFVYDAATGFTQVTDTTGGSGSENPIFSTDGTRVVFHSNSAFVSGENADGNTEIFLWSCLPVSPVPEPNAIVYLLYGLGGLVLVLVQRHRRNRRA